MGRRSKSSHRWLSRQRRDPSARQAADEGHVSRAHFKLSQIDQRFGLLKHGMKVLELGAAPGGWSQYAARVLRGQGRIIAMDILPMEPLDGVEFLQGDFREDEVLEALMVKIDDRAIDLVMSDMAPNISGVAAVDQPRSMYLCELALEFARQTLRPGGDFLVKVFQGEGFDEFFRQMRESFGKVVTRKPQASRSKSREVYLLGRDFKV